MYQEDVLYEKNGKLEEIDNSLISKNDYKVYFKKTSDDYLMKFKRNNNYICFMIDKCNLVNIQKQKMKLKLYQKVMYPNIKEKIDIEYLVMPNKVKEKIVFKQKTNEDDLTFIVKTNMTLILENNKIIASSNNEKIIELEAPYMVDATGLKTNEVYYELSKRENKYLLNLKLDKKWLNDKSRKYPVTIDPSISNIQLENSVYDTYIYEGDDLIDKNNLDILKSGVEKVNGHDRINRTLLKFELPELSTSDEIIDATLYLVSYKEEGKMPNENKLVEIHRVTQDWTEKEATWSKMYDKYDAGIEGIYYSRRSTVEFDENNIVIVPEYGMIQVKITDLVKRWYTDTENYHSGKKSFEIYTSKDEEYEKEVDVFSSSYYTFSGYFISNKNFINYRIKVFK